MEDDNKADIVYLLQGIIYFKLQVTSDCVLIACN